MYLKVAEAGKAIDSAYKASLYFIYAYLTLNFFTQTKSKKWGPNNTSVKRKAACHGVCERIITKYWYILISLHLNQETHVPNYTMHSDSCMIFLQLQPNAIVQANCVQAIVRSQLTDSQPWKTLQHSVTIKLSHVCDNITVTFKSIWADQ